MVNKYKDEIAKLEIEARKHAQEQSRFTARAEILRLRGRIEELETTVQSLDTAILESEKMLSE